jgi:hypothetical protein
MKNLNNIRLVNLTPHELVIFDAKSDSVVLRVPPSGVVARVSTKEVQVGTINGVPLLKTEYGNVENLPEPQENTIYVVSALVLQALQASGVKREDVVAPNTGPSSLGAVRDSQGRIVGVKSFIVL